MDKDDENRLFGNGIFVGFLATLMLGIVPLTIFLAVNSHSNWNDGYTAGQADVLGGNAPVIVEQVRQADGTEQWEVVKPFPDWVRRNYKQHRSKVRGY
jgi:hypothetical protein